MSQLQPGCVWPPPPANKYFNKIPTTAFERVSALPSRASFSESHPYTFVRMTIANYLFVNSLERETQALARGLRRRDPDLLDHLVEQYHYRLFRYLLCLTGSREAAEDFFQETWVRVIDRGHQYNGKFKFETWLFTIARNLVIDFRRRKEPGSLDALIGPGERQPMSEPAASDTLSPAELAAAHEESDRVAAALACLPAIHREVLLLRFQEDLSLEEIAAVVAAPLSTVKSRLYRGLSELREKLERENV
jgi:RNA polymerase sigma-70 factor, ECF subfamily